MSHDEVMNKIKAQDRLISIMDQSAALLLTTEIDGFENNLIKSMSMMAEAVGADRVYICSNHIYRNELCFTQIYEWPKGSSAKRKTEYLTNVPYRKTFIGREDVLSSGKCINILVRDVQSDEVRDVFLTLGVLSVFLAPVFVGDKFWGFVGFENCRFEKVFSENELSILRSGCLLIGNAFLYHEMVVTLKNSAEEAQAANRSKSAFLAGMSHEIRTPMNAIIGITEILLRNENLDKSTCEHLSKIHNSGEMLLGIVNDILDLSKIESGKLELIPKKYESTSLINDTVMLNLMHMEDKSIDFKLTVDESIPVTLFGDELRIKQILNNLLSNAFKYTDEGVVELSFGIEDRNTDGSLVLVIRVSDTGFGMTEKQVEKLFDEYTRFNHNTTVPGTGLGMNITRNLLELMGGEILVKSELRKGTVITVRIPQKSVGVGVIGRGFADILQDFRTTGLWQAKKTNIAYEPMPYGYVLIVDDVDINLIVAEGLLAPYNLSVETAESGFEAIDRIKAGKVYDVIFMDHMMPEMDGVETVRILRGMGYTEPIVALTANAVTGEMDFLLSNGFDDFMSKPADVRQMNTVLKKYVRDKQPAEVIETARLQMKSRERIPDKGAYLSVSSSFVRFFLKDARDAVSVLEEVSAKAGVYDDEDIHLYTASVHAMKTALFNVGERHLSAIAAEMENAGWKKDTAAIAVEIPGFINELNAVISRFSTDATNEASDIDMTGEDINEKIGVVS